MQRGRSAGGAQCVRGQSRPVRLAQTQRTERRTRATPRSSHSAALSPPPHSPALSPSLGPAAVRRMFVRVGGRSLPLLPCFLALCLTCSGGVSSAAGSAISLSRTKLSTGCCLRNHPSRDELERRPPDTTSAEPINSVGMATQAERDAEELAYFRAQRKQEQAREAAQKEAQPDGGGVGGGGGGGSESGVIGRIWRRARQHCGQCFRSSAAATNSSAAASSAAAAPSSSSSSSFYSAWYAPLLAFCPCFTCCCRGSSGIGGPNSSGGGGGGCRSWCCCCSCCCRTSSAVKYAALGSDGSSAPPDESVAIEMASSSSVDGSNGHSHTNGVDHDGPINIHQPYAAPSAASLAALAAAAPLPSQPLTSLPPLPAKSPDAQGSGGATGTSGSAASPLPKLAPPVHPIANKTLLTKHEPSKTQTLHSLDDFEVRTHTHTTHVSRSMRSPVPGCCSLYAPCCSFTFSSVLLLLSAFSASRSRSFSLAGRFLR